MIDATLADIIGLVGSAIFIAAFAYVNFAGEMDKLWYNAANLVGAILLLISLSVHFNLAATILEAAWGLIALAGLVAAMRKRGAPLSKKSLLFPTRAQRISRRGPPI